MAQQIVGYTQDGSPLYENVPDGQPPLVAGEEPLPPMNNGMTLDQLDAMSQGSGIDMRRDDLAAASGEVPQQVANDVAQSSPEVRRAEPALQNEGSYFDLSYIEQMRNAYQQALQQSGGDQQKAAAMVKPVWNSFTPVQKHVYQQAEGFASLDPKFAAGLAVKYHEDQKRMQDDRQKMADDPLKQAQVSERNAKVVERQAVQNDFKIRRQNTIKNIEEILADKDYSSLVGPFDGTVGSVYDAAFNEKMQAKRAKLDRLINIDVLDMTKYLRPISQDELKYLRTLVPGQRQNWEVYKQYLGEKLDMLKATDRAVVNPATNQPLPNDEGQSAPQPQQNVYQQSQQNPASQLRQQLESSDTLNLPDGRVLKRATKQDGSIGWQ
jgi:hypothetical protein